MYKTWVQQAASWADNRWSLSDLDAAALLGALLLALLVQALPVAVAARALGARPHVLARSNGSLALCCLGLQVVVMVGRSQQQPMR